MICTFFGHRDCPDKIKNTLKSEIKRLITEKGITLFYVGNKGAFDRLVYSCLKEIKKEYEYINFYVVLEKIPSKTNIYERDETILPQGIENVPPRFAIIYRNKWMLEKAQYVITYVTRSMGGAARFSALASKREKKVINIADII
ncbi:MAG: hypothetical protein IJ946_06795 [Clostridia bacterium]|nr:hypothetical protein [Clostridia bacterium]